MVLSSPKVLSTYEFVPVEISLILYALYVVSFIEYKFPSIVRLDWPRSMVELVLPSVLSKDYLIESIVN